MSAVLTEYLIESGAFTVPLRYGAAPNITVIAKRKKGKTERVLITHVE